MDIEIEIIRGLPVEQINLFEDKVVYNTAIATREFTKSRNAFPYRTGTLRREEIKEPVVGSQKEYGLTAGVDYATSVWKMTNVNWTNKSTKPQWYYNCFNEKGALLLCDAVLKAKKEI